MKTLSKRQMVLQHMSVAGYTGDVAKFMRLYCENRISRATADKAYLDGQNKRTAVTA